MAVNPFLGSSLAQAFLGIDDDFSTGFADDHRDARKKEREVMPSASSLTFPRRLNRIHLSALSAACSRSCDASGLMHHLARLDMCRLSLHRDDVSASLEWF